MNGADAIGNYFLGIARREGAFLNPMGLERLVILSEAWHLTLFGRSLICESILAESYGPSVPSLRDFLMPLGNEPVLEDLQRPDEPVRRVATEDVETREFLDRIWEAHRGYNAIALANMTVTDDSPWRAAIEKHPSEERPVIEKRLWISYYQKFV